MTGKTSSIIVLGVIVTGVVLFALISLFANSTVPITKLPPGMTCAEQGLIVNPAETTKCILPRATTTSSTTPPAPAPLPTPKPSTSDTFDTVVTLTIKQTITVGDGLTITLLTINDSRCKADVQCIWAGELAPEFSVTGGSFGTNVETVSLGTSRTTSVTVGAYALTLINATENNATLAISKTALAQSKGTVSGTVTVGPICPVERIDEPCVAPPETYTSRKVVVYGPTETTKISETPLTGDGSYTLTLAPGNYWLQIEPAGIGPGEKKPVAVKTSEIVIIDFDIDSGIR